MDQKPHLVKKLTDVKCERMDESLVPSFEDETMEVQHLLAEPKSDHASVDGVLCLDKENSEKQLKVEDYNCDFDYGWKINYGWLDYNTQGGGDDLKLEVLDGLLDEVDEVDDVHAAHDLSSACEDFLLDFPEKLTELDCGPQEGSHLGNSSSESHSPGFSGASSSAGGILELSIATIQETDCKSGLLAKAASCEIHRTFRSKCGCQTPVVDTICPTTEDLHNLDESDEDEKPLVSLILSSKKAKRSAKVTKSAAHLRQKRLRKPTQRYIEEFSRISAAAAAAGKDKCQKVRFHDGPPQMTTELQIRRGRPKKDAPKVELESDHELPTSESENEQKKTKRSKLGDRRKHQRMWTLAEVIKLVDGISQYGVGRWTEIKRLLFSSSAYRTPVDLRDKWRNLLRSSCAHKHNKREVEHNLKHSVRPLPKTILRQIRELAAIHPYPKARSPMNSGGDCVASPIHPATTKCAPLCPGGRNLRRKKCP